MSGLYQILKHGQIAIVVGVKVDSDQDQDQDQEQKQEHAHAVVYIPLSESSPHYLPQDHVQVQIHADLSVPKSIEEQIRTSGYTHEVIKVGSLRGLVARAIHKGICGLLYIKSPVIHGINANGLTQYKFRPLDSTYPEFIVASRVTPNQYHNHLYAVVDFLDWESQHKYPRGACQLIIGEIGQFPHEITAHLHANHLVFPKIKNAILHKELNATPPETDSNGITRLDLVEKFVFSIDPPGCQDIDDALHLEYDAHRDIYHLGIHIADVSEYVPVGSNLDQHAQQRMTSLYLPNGVIPMLPTQLSEDRCSLRQDQVRLTLSLLLELSPQGEILKSQFQPTRIRNRRAMTYEHAEKLINKGGHILTTLHQLLLKVHEKYPHAIGEDNVEDHVPHAHFVVETCMVLANVLCAEHLVKTYGDAILRVHPEMDYTRFQNQSQSLDKQEFSPVTHNMIQTYIKHRSQHSAKYQVYSSHPTHTQHFGLRAQYYTHFTSPIRRYVDLVIHRLIKGDRSQLTQLCHIADRANQIQTQSKHLYRDLKYLQIINQLEQLGQGGQPEIRVSAYIVDLMTHNPSAQVKIYLPHYNQLTATLTLKHQAEAQLYRVEKSDTHLHITTLSTQDTQTYQIYQPIEVRLTPMLNVTQFTKKLRIWLDESDDKLSQ